MLHGKPTCASYDSGECFGGVSLGRVNVFLKDESLAAINEEVKQKNPIVVL